jgi:surface antigen/peptidoglycan hydrolase CwlO-like protein
LSGYRTGHNQQRGSLITAAIRNSVKNASKQSHIIIRPAFLGLLLAIFTLVNVYAPIVNADRFSDQIDALNSQNSATANADNVLEVEAASLADKIAGLQREITGMETQIRDNQARSVQLQRKIIETQAELERQQLLLKDAVRALYKRGNASTTELLIASDDFSEFMNEQEYLERLKNDIQTSTEQVKIMKAEIENQKVELDKLILDQQAIQVQLDRQRTEQARLLALNQEQQAAYEAQIRDNSTRIASLKKEQAEENARLFAEAQRRQGGSGTVSRPGVGANCGGGYPGSAPGPWGTWGCNYALDNTIDSWGMYNRECVSYTAFKVSASGRHMPYWGGRGNAKQWDDNARAAGIPVTSTPHPGDVGVSNAGTWGHVFYVEQTASDGAIFISDYNQQYDGRYREYWLSAETVQNRGFVFIRF